MNRTEPYQSNKNGSSRRKPEEIREEIQDTRHRIDDSVNEISDRTSASSIGQSFLDQVAGIIESLDLQKTGEKVAQLGRSTSRRVKENPLPVALGLLAAATAFIPRDAFKRFRSNETDDYPEPDFTDPHATLQPVSPNDISHWEEAADQSSTPDTESNSENSRISEMKDSLYSKAGDLSDSTREWAKQSKDSVANTASQVTDKVRAKTQQASQRLQEGKENNPEMLALGAIALGFLASVALPRTRRENELCGERADRLKQRVADKGRQVLEDNQLDADGIENRIEDAIEDTESALEEKIDEHIKP